MVFYGVERPNWVKPNDPFFATFRNKCTNRVIWLLTTLPTIATTKDEKPISVLEFFLSMAEENFWKVMDSCPDCSRYVLFDAHHQHFKRKARQLANMANQEDDLAIDLCFKFSFKNQSMDSLVHKTAMWKAHRRPSEVNNQIYQLDR